MLEPSVLSKRGGMEGGREEEGLHPYVEEGVTSFLMRAPKKEGIGTKNEMLSMINKARVYLN